MNRIFSEDEEDEDEDVVVEGRKLTLTGASFFLIEIVPRRRRSLFSALTLTNQKEEILKKRSFSFKQTQQPRSAEKERSRQFP